VSGGEPHFIFLHSENRASADLANGLREAIVAALKQSKGKVSGPGGAAELLGVKPTTLASRIASLGLNRRAIN
jgi:transcriptional regulator with GAF, ATPase, and Fis domain